MEIINKIGNENLYLILAITAAIGAIVICIMHKRIQRDREEEIIAAISNFCSVEADLKQHLKDDGIIQPEPGSEEHFQRWKAEREKRQ